MRYRDGPFVVGNDIAVNIDLVSVAAQEKCVSTGQSQIAARNLHLPSTAAFVHASGVEVPNVAKSR